LKDFLLKDAASLLNVNYSTAKTILRIFRLEKRISKKCTHDVSCLKSLKKEKRKKFNITRNEKYGKTESGNNQCKEPINEYNSNTTFLSNCVCRDRKPQNEVKNLVESDLNSVADKNNVMNDNFIENRNFTNSNTVLKNENLPRQIKNNFTNPNGNMILNLNVNNGLNGFIFFQRNEQLRDLIQYVNLSQTIQTLSGMVNTCFENLKYNQSMINSIFNSINKGN